MVLLINLVTNSRCKYTFHGSELYLTVRYYPRSRHESSPSIFQSDPGRHLSFSEVPQQFGFSLLIVIEEPQFVPLRADIEPQLNLVSRGTRTVRSAFLGILPEPKIRRLPYYSGLLHLD